MKRKIAVIYAIFLLICMIIGSVFVYYFAWQKGVGDCVKAIVGFFIGVAFAPILHELGHILFAKINRMELVESKFFCFRLYRKNGEIKLSFASPFSQDETQVLPKTEENMSSRAIAYALGGVIVEGAALFAVAVLAIVFACINQSNYFLFGLLPYLSYLFLLNILPLEYASGKTDILVCRGIKKGYPAEQAMLTAMEIHGALYSGKTFLELEEEKIKSFPVLAEDEPMFAVILDLKYRYYLNKNQLEKAGDCLNRLVAVQEYLPAAQVEQIAAELVYFHSIYGNQESAQACSEYCKEYLKTDTPLAKRALAAYSNAFGKEEAVAPLLEQARKLLETERIQGVKVFEETLLSRIEQAEKVEYTA